MRWKSITRPIAAALLLASTAHVARAEVNVGKPAPDFSLPDTSGKTVGLADQKGKYVVLEWTNEGCPFVVKHYSSGNMPKLQDTYTQKGVTWLSMASSAPGKQGNHTPDEWTKVQADRKAKPTALLLDPDGKVGKAYGAKTTPHMYVIDPQGTLIYQGAIDDNPSPNAADIPKSTNYVATALDESMAGKPVSKSSTQAYGCSVKYP